MNPVTPPHRPLEGDSQQDDDQQQGPAASRLRSLLLRAEPRLRGFARDLCRGGGTVEPDDVVQEAMAKAWRYRETLDLEQDGVPWLLRIAFRVYLDQTKPRPRLAPLEETAEPVCPQPDAARTADGRDAVAALVRDLKPIQRDLLLGFHRDGASLQDLANRHGLPVNTIKSHLHRARLILRADGGRP